MDGQDLVDLQRGHGQGDQRDDLVAFLQVEAGLLLQVLADVSNDTLEHTAGTGDRILLLAALSDDAQDLAHVIVDLPSSLGQNALGLDNAVGTVLVAFQFSHFSFLLKIFI